MKSVFIGIANGIIVSCVLLLFLALWPLTTETSFSPDHSAGAPSAPSTPLTADSVPPTVTEPVRTEEEMMMTKTEPPTEAERIPVKSERPDPPAALSKDPVASKKSAPPRTIPTRPTAKPNRGPEPTKPPQTKKEPESVETAAVAPAPSVPPPVIRPDKIAINALLDKIRSAYAQKNISAIKESAVISSDDEDLLKKIFNYYKTVQVDTEELNGVENGVATAVVIRSLENEKGNAVIPAPKWGRQPLLITPRNDRWDQARFYSDLLGDTSRASIDLAAPTILHALPMYAAKPGESVEISATITDNAKVAAATLRFRALGDQKYESTPMSEGTEHAYSVRIPGSMIKGSNIEYYIEARDAEGNISMEGRPTSPLAIAVLPSKSDNE